MRAIIKCKTNMDPKGLDGILIEIGWWPTLDQNDQEVEGKRNDILAHVSEEDRVLVEKTMLYTIYDETTKTWGIVNSPNKNAITFRLRNSISDRLKDASERLVAALQQKALKDKSVTFDFTGQIEILERASPNYSFFGHVVPYERWTFILDPFVKTTNREK